jgi:hypothetical protein
MTHDEPADDPRVAALAEARYRRDCDGSHLRKPSEWPRLPGPVRTEYERQAGRDLAAMDRILTRATDAHVPAPRTG